MPEPARTIIVGRHSKVWTSLATRDAIRALSPVPISHAEVAAFSFARTDRVWVLSYSRSTQENRALIAAIVASGVTDVVYVSSASTNVLTRTTCYEYPRVKADAEREALRAGCRVLRIGLVYGREDELPGGTTAATSLDEIAAFMAAPAFPSADVPAHVFRPITRPFVRPGERLLYRVYGVLLRWAGPWPCALRPFDVVLRALGMRWYGYLYLSNRLWFTTTS